MPPTRAPIQHYPRGPEWKGESGPHAKMWRIVVTLNWTDGTTSIHELAYAHRWTRTHVQVIVKFGVHGWRELCVKAGEVKPRPDPIKPGDFIPQP